MFAMKSLLAIDASSAQCIIALGHRGAVSHTVLPQSITQTKQLIPSIKSLLAQQQLSYQQLDALVLGVGPGRFTGLRVASSVVQGIAMGADLPVLRISSLQVMAQSAYQLNHHIVHFLVVTNAHMQEVYVGQYRVVEGVCEPVSQDDLMAPEAMCAMPLPDHPWAAIGDGWHVYHDKLDAMRQDATVSHLDLYPQPESLLFLGQRALEAGQTHDYQQALPNYVRRAKAWKKAN